MNLRRFRLLSLLALCAMGAGAQQAWPAKPIALVVPFAAGGPTDVVARTLAASMSKTLGQTVVHHNGMATSTALYRKLPYNPLTDFEFVSQAVDVPMTLLARKDFPANNLQELMAYVKANKEKRMTELGAEIVPDSKLNPEALQTWLKAGIDKWGPIIRATGTFAD